MLVISDKRDLLVISNRFGILALAGLLIVLSIWGLNQNEGIYSSYLPICVSAPLDHTFAARGRRKVVSLKITFLTAWGVLKNVFKKMFPYDFGDALLHGEGYRVPPNGPEGII